MPKSLPWGQVRIRQVYSREGQNYCAISMPVAAMDLLGWKPGQLLSYYPTKDKGLKLMLSTMLFETLGDFDASGGKREAEGEDWRAPKEGSVSERRLEIEKTLQEAMASVSRLGRGKIKEGGVDEEEERAENTKSGAGLARFARAAKSGRGSGSSEVRGRRKNR